MNSGSRIPEKVVGLTIVNGQLKFLLKFQGSGDEADLITANEAYILCPQLILEYYKEHLKWHDGGATPPKKKKKVSSTKKKSEKSCQMNKKTPRAKPTKTPEKILGATDASGELKFLIKWRGIEEGDLIAANEAHLLCPQLLLQWYEERITWNDRK